MSLDRLWQLSYDSKTIDIIRDSHYAIPVIQTFHLLGITLVLSAMVILNFRMLGIALREIPLSKISQYAWRWGTRGLLLAIFSGVLVFIPDPARYAANHSFLVKMSVLTIAILFQYTLHRRVVRADVSAAASRRHWIVPIVSLCLWFGVGWAGRAIAFLG